MNTDSTQSDKLERQISAQIRASIAGSPDEINGETFAINWFDTRSAWIYHLYNWLAAGRVHEVGGKVFFKGKVLKELSGNPDLARQFLLIVNYPSGNAFLDLLSNRKFQITSILRILAVRRFSFGFQKRIIGPPPSEDSSAAPAPKRSYAMLHIQDAREIDLGDVRHELNNLSTAYPRQIEFLGRESGRLQLTKGSRKPETLDFITGITLILSAAEGHGLDKLLKSKLFQKFLCGFQDHYAATIRRLM